MSLTSPECVVSLVAFPFCTFDQQRWANPLVSVLFSFFVDGGLDVDANVSFLHFAG